MSSSSSSSSSSTPAKRPKLEITTNPNWLELPRDITSNILQRLGTVEILKNARNVCPYWWNICKDPSMWRNIDMGTVDQYFEPDIPGTPDHDRLVKMCQYAVDLSSGHLEKIHIYRFGTDNLLRYIADRAKGIDYEKALSMEWKPQTLTYDDDDDDDDDMGHF
ncbi:F-box protein skip19 [Trifolium pratense]|uniref:F-box protein skip19 n=1 Tax=Trifolium pratense TaxID=57577 RepID=A0A2K3M1L4_TRIPR|nr:F-box protein skip19 [Trifolium pratense]